MNEIGVIYAVTGEKYLSEVRTSVKSVRKSNPDVPITVFSDIRPSEELLDDIHVDHIDITGTKFPKRPKVECLRQTPYNKTLYLDSDTYIQGDLNEIFDFLNGFDLVCWRGEHNYEFVHKSRKDKEFPGEISNEEEFRERLELTTPRIMPDYNSGVIAYNMNDEVGEFLSNWESIYQKHLSLNIPGYHRDQPAFRKAMFETDVKVSGALPPECNCRVKGLYESRGLIQRIQWKPIVIHGGPHDIQKAANKINDRVENRGYIVKPKNIFNIMFDKTWIFFKSIQYDGVKTTANRVKEYISKSLLF